MKVDGTLTGPVASAGGLARELEDAGYDAVWTIEGPNDPFLPHVIAAEHTARIELRNRHRRGLRATR